MLLVLLLVLLVLLLVLLVVLVRARTPATAALDRVKVSAHELQLLLPGVVVKQIRQEVVVKGRRVDVRTQVDGGLVVSDVTTELSCVSVARGRLLTVGQRPGGNLVQVRHLHGQSKAGHTWRGAAGIQGGQRPGPRERERVGGPRIRVRDTDTNTRREREGERERMKEL